MRVVDHQEMKLIENEAIEKFGFTEPLIIENVGIQGAYVIDQNLLQHIDFGEILILVGQGNNGSDGLAIGRHLRNRGHSVRAFMLFPEEDLGAEVRRQRDMARAFGVKITELKSFDQLDAYFAETHNDFFVIDAIFGTGFRLPLSNFLFDIINAVNDYASFIVSIDMPSGITGDTGRMSSTAIRANITLAVGLPKIGQYVSYGAVHSGELVTLDAGFPAPLLEGGDKFLLSTDSMVSLYEPRNKFAHKNSFGHSLIVGGSQGLTGALIMAANSALRVGTGLVSAATWSDNYGELASRIIPEIMTGLIPTEEDEIASILRDLSRYHSVVIGPGLGRSERARSTVLELLNNFSGPVVVDADALKVLNLEEDRLLLAQRKFPTILTPHMGEFAHLCGLPVDQVLDDPIAHLKNLVDQTNSSIILKGACTFLGFPNGEIFINYYPNDGMASGGSGDVLAGILGGLLSQLPVDRKRSTLFDDKTKFYEALRLGVLVHTLAGKYAVDKLGPRAMSAGSIIEHLSQAFAELEGDSANASDFAG
jgi:ADP-dependent NAD(P)H-hydrate dehydratase / NAD(P)H-hydrate epimerase